jgi:putative proteasome-type protease
MLLDAGLVFLADSRTNAGVDQISTFRKVAIFDRPGKCIMVLLSAGNLAISQALTSILRERNEQSTPQSMFNAPNMFEATLQVGDALREVHRRDAESLKEHHIEFNASFIFGGQIGAEPPRLFCIYAG